MSCFCFRNPPSESPDGGTAQFLAKQEILWKGFLNMLNIAKFVTKGYLVSGSGENLKVVWYYYTVTNLFVFVCLFILFFFFF